MVLRRRCLATAVALGGLLSAGCSAGHATTSSHGGLLSRRVVAPTLSGATLGGGTLSTASYAGSVVVLNFYASWCSPCVAETPLLEATSRANPEVHFLGVLYDDSAGNGASFRRTYGVTYPSLVDPDGSDLAKFRKLSPSDLPVTFVLDKAGRVAARYFGGIGPSSGLQQVLTKLQRAAS